MHKVNTKVCHDIVGEDRDANGPFSPSSSGYATCHPLGSDAPNRCFSISLSKNLHICHVECSHSALKEHARVDIVYFPQLYLQPHSLARVAPHHLVAPRTGPMPPLCYAISSWIERRSLCMPYVAPLAKIFDFHLF